MARCLQSFHSIAELQRLTKVSSILANSQRLVQVVHSQSLDGQRSTD